MREPSRRSSSAFSQPFLCPLPDQRLVQSHQGGVHRDGDHGEVEVVEHDGNVVVQPSAGVEVQAQSAAADHGDGWHVPQPARERG